MTTTFVPAITEDPPEGYPSDWEQSVVLKDGGTMRIRPIAPGDADGLQDLVRSLSSESSYFRFFRVKKELTAEELHDFTILDYSTRMAFIAILDGRIVGVGRYNTADDDPDLAEVAFTVADGMQGRGIGTVLLFRLSAYARSRGIAGFRAFLLADNHAMMRVFRNAGFSL
ncbi:MAG: GNAT family N-acetyltransferase, partial [Acidimicrobiia bacterium]